MNAIDAAILLGDRLGRERALRPDETDALHMVVRIVKPNRAWTRQEDAALLREASRYPRGYANRLAVELGRSPWSVRSRLRKLKARG
jgi:hypothetical protein